MERAKANNRREKGPEEEKGFRHKSPKIERRNRQKEPSESLVVARTFSQQSPKKQKATMVIAGRFQ
jgi:hypothetical protein